MDLLVLIKFQAHSLNDSNKNLIFLKADKIMHEFFKHYLPNSDPSKRHN